MSTVTTRDRGAEILARLINPEQGSMTADAARSLLSFRLPPEDRERVNELAEKARADALTEDERSELTEYERVTALLELLQSKARASLKRAGLWP
jgi:hypothetical protein